VSSFSAVAALLPVLVLARRAVASQTTRVRFGLAATLLPVATLAACGSIGKGDVAATQAEGGTVSHDAGGRRDAGVPREAGGPREGGGSHDAVGPHETGPRDASARREAGRDALAEASDAAPDRHEAGNASSTPITMAAKECSPGYIALDDHDVYWLNQCGSNNDYGAVMKAPKAGGAAVTLAPAQPDPWNTAVSAEAVYWTLLSEDAQLVSVPLTGIPDGGWVSYLYPTDGGTSPEITGIAADANHVFWSAAVNDDEYVAMSALDGTDVTFLSLSGLKAPFGVTLDCPMPAGSCSATQVHVMGAVGDSGQQWAIYALAVGGGAVTSVASNLSLPPSAVAWSPAGLFWTAWETTLTGMPYVVLSSASGTPIASGTGMTLGIAADATSVYWISYYQGSDGVVLKAPVAGGAITTIASGQSEPSSIAVDDTFVYWTNAGSTVGEPAGSVMRAPK